MLLPELELPFCELLVPLSEPDCEPVLPCEPCEPCWLWLLEFVLKLVLVLLERPLGLVPALLPVSRCIEPLELLEPDPVAPWSRF